MNPPQTAKSYAGLPLMKAFVKNGHDAYHGRRSTFLDLVMGYRTDL